MMEFGREGRLQNSHRLVGRYSCVPFLLNAVESGNPASKWRLTDAEAGNSYEDDYSYEELLQRGTDQARLLSSELLDRGQQGAEHENGHVMVGPSGTSFSLRHHRTNRTSRRTGKRRSAGLRCQGCGSPLFQYAGRTAGLSCGLKLGNLNRRTAGEPHCWRR